jgi:hypothetical protein
MQEKTEMWMGISEVEVNEYRDTTSQVSMQLIFGQWRLGRW